MSARDWKRLGWISGAALALAAVGFVFKDRVSVAELSHAMQRGIEVCRDAGPLVFFSAMALLPACGFPLAPFLLSAGPAFAPRLGLTGVVLCALLAVAANLALSYAIAARLLRPLITRVVTHFGYRLPVVTGDSAFFTTVALRLVPGPPFFLQNYLLGLARIPFGLYMFVSFSAIASYLIATIILADALVRKDPWAIAAAAGIFFVTGGLLHQFRRRLPGMFSSGVTAGAATAPVAATRSDNRVR